jgi:diguanylate cyclase (GGDEF)-like protein/PAS domain S-box-containing protein
MEDGSGTGVLQEELPDIGETLRAAIDAVPAMISAKDRDSRYIFMNRWQADIYGVTPSEAVGRTAAELIDGEYGARTRERDLQVISSGAPLPYFEEEFPGKGKHACTMLTTKVPLLDRAGRVAGVVTASLDITKRKETEAALKASEARTKQAITILTSAIESMNDGFILLDGSDRFVMCNKRYREYYPEIEDLLVRGMPLERIMVAYSERSGLHSNPEEFLDTRRRAWKAGHSVVESTPQGRWIETRDKAADGGYWVGICIDVTERKRTEQALWDSEERYRSLFEAAPISLWEQDWSELKDFVEQTEKRSGESFASLLDKQPELLGSAMAHIRILTVNEATATLFGSKSKQRILLRFMQQGATSPHWVIRQQLLGLLRGQWRVTSEYEDLRDNGESCHIRATLEMPKKHRKDWKRVLTAAADITEARALSQQLEYQATHDALTGLVNRREFEARLEQMLRSADVDRSEHAVCYLDLDQFKVINDTCGHAAGDELLRSLGKILARRVRSTDTLARLGGDEFGVLLEHCMPQKALQIARALRNAIDEFQFVWGEQRFSIGVSIGLVPIRGHGATIKDVLSAADAACYAAKDQGRNRIQMYHEENVELARRQGEMAWVARIQRAIEQRRFVLARQPIVAASRSEQAVGSYYELLVRMTDEEGELVLPEDFLAAAERYNLSTKIDRWVVTTAFRMLAHQRHQMDGLYLCSINLSGLSLLEVEFLDFVADQFAEFEIPADKICFEITETAVITNLSSAMRFIERLRNLGCSFALDDFGSGLSSFAYLKNLPVDYLKIDGVFVRNVLEDPIDRAMVKSINDIGHVMGKKTIAEFVEDQKTLDLLKDIGVDYFQGYATGEPQLLNPFADTKDDRATPLRDQG